jgi:hypothetical protein
MPNYLISFPSSGQHLTERMLKHYCEYTKQQFSYCEFYSSCKKTPCDCKPKRLFQKQHDFQLNIKIEHESKYLVLYRTNLQDQLFAWYRVNKKLCKNMESLPKFIEQRRQFYIDFVDKWINTSYTNILVVSYDEIVINPYCYSSIFAHFFPSNDDYNNEHIINLFLQKEPIIKKTYE